MPRRGSARRRWRPWCARAPRSRRRAPARPARGSLAERVDGGTTRIEVDVTDEAAARAFIEDSATELDGLDILVNNAGVMLLGPVEGADVEQWQRMINVNLLGLLYCTHAALPIMGDGGGGHIVNVSSVAGRQAQPRARPSTT